jgi:16S rRNA (guanine1207-N2)-methyltransferase
MASRDPQRYDLALLTRHIRLAAGDRVLEMGYYDLGAALWAAGQGADVVALRPNVDLATELEERSRAAGVQRLETRIALRPEPEERGTFDVALLLAPFFLGNQPVRSALTIAAAALKPEGTLYFQVHRHHGGDTFIRFARELFDSVEQVDVGTGQRRLIRAAGPQAQEALVEADGPETPAAPPLHEMAVGGTVVRYRLAAGVFGARGIDPASRLLVQTVLEAGLPARAAILDLGCGAGTIGLALAAACPGGHVVLVDSSRPAVELAQENARRNELANVEIHLSDGYGAVERQRFDAIVSNLPAHRGHQAESATAERFIAGAPAHLRSNGEAWFVANRALPYELPASRVFRQVRVAAIDGRYKVLRCNEPSGR